MATKTSKPLLDMTPFCNSQFRRYDFSSPWEDGGWTYASDGGWVYASDGMMLVRAPAGSAAPAGSGANRKVPKNIAWFFEGIDKAKFSKWPAANVKSAHGDCVVCKGSGRLGQKTCAHCGSEYREPCWNCGGAGCGVFPCYQEISGVRVSIVLLTKLALLPKPLRCANSGRLDMLWIEFRGGHAAVMGMTG